MNMIINAVTNEVKRSLTFHHEGGSMLRNFSVLVVVALMSVTSVYAQDWGTDAGSDITIMGASGAVDVPGEGAMRVGGMDVIADVPGSTTVSAVYNMGVIGTNTNPPVVIGDTVWVPYFLKNLGNNTDSLQVYVNIYNSTMDVMDALIAEDMDGDTAINLMGSDMVVSSTGNYGVLLPEDGSRIIFVGVVIPDTAVDGDSAIYNVMVSDNMGTGSDDMWPSNYPAYTLAPDNGDMQNDTFQVSIGMPIIHFATMVSSPTAAPGDTLLYTLSYDNDGSDSTDVASGGQLYITQMLPQYVKYAVASFNYSKLHTNAGATPWFSSLASPVSFNQSETWANTNPDSVAGFKIDFSGNIQANENSEGTDTPGGVDGEIPDVDAGQVMFQVIVK